MGKQSCKFFGAVHLFLVLWFGFVFNLKDISHTEEGPGGGAEEAWGFV